MSQRVKGLLLLGSYRPAVNRVGSGEPRCLGVPHHAAESSSGLEQRAQALPASTPLLSSSSCLRDTIASFNILYLAPAKRGNSQGEEERLPHIMNSSFI